MTVGERRKYVVRMLPRYAKAARCERGRLLDEMEVVTGLHRKSLIRLLRPRGLERKKRRRERGKKYTHEVDDVIRVVAEALDYVCAERLTPVLLKTAQHLARHGELTLTPKTTQALGEVSISTVGRICGRLGQDRPRLPRKGPEEANRLAKAIPMGRIKWNEAGPGHFEVDLVHHGGESAQGDYVHTLQLVDVATGWSERVAVLGRGGQPMERAFEKIIRRLPFPIIELHPDNGSEFMNHHLVRYFKDRIQGVRLSRSRPYEKNDNRFVEQKNDTLVRAYLGRVRLEGEGERKALDELYERMWLYYNFFQPVMRLKEKSYEAGKLKREWDHARTPFDRLIETGVLSHRDREQLEALKGQTNPRTLRQEIYDLRDELLCLPFTSKDNKPESAA